MKQMEPWSCKCIHICPTSGHYKFERLDLMSDLVEMYLIPMYVIVPCEVGTEGDMVHHPIYDHEVFVACGETYEE